MTDFDILTHRKDTNCVKWDETDDRDIIPLWVADMDYEVAPAIKKAVMQRAEQGIFGYTHVPEDYYTAIQHWFSRRHGWNIQRDWIQYTTGVVPAISVCIKALTQPGDKVLIQTPVYNCFFSCIRNSGCELVESKLICQNDKFFIDYVDFEEKCADPDVKVFLLCNPHNPVGRVWSKDELLRLQDICRRHNVVVVSDEIHNELTFPGIMYTPFASVSKAAQENCITLCSPSKSFNTAGLQIANIITCNAEWRKKTDRVINIYELCDVNPFGVLALMAAYNESEEWLDELRSYLYINYCELQKFLNTELPQLRLTRMEGTYLAWVDIRATGKRSDELAELLLSKAKVRISSGTIYGEQAGEGFIRINFATQRARLMEGLGRMAKVINQL